MINGKAPFGWGNDPITQYLDIARLNQFASFARKRSEVIDLTTIDAMLRKLLDGAINPKPLLPIEFLLRAHSAYLPSVDAVMAGRIYELQLLLRGALEQAGYSHFVGLNQERWERWMGRHNEMSNSQRKKWNDEFTQGAIRRDLKAASPVLESMYSELYKRTIDYGAHPNERGVSVNSVVKDELDGGKTFDAIYLNGNEDMIDFGLESTAQVGLCVLRIAELIYPTRFQALGITQPLGVLVRRY